MVDKTSLGVRLKSGRVRFYHWRGFTLEVNQPVKLVVEAFTIESAWDPRKSGSKMPDWEVLKDGEYLLGSWANGFDYTALPFRIV